MQAGLCETKPEACFFFSLSSTGLFSTTPLWEILFLRILCKQHFPLESFLTYFDRSWIFTYITSLHSLSILKHSFLIFYNKFSSRVLMALLLRLLAAGKITHQHTWFVSVDELKCIWTSRQSFNKAKEECR